jgi:hypothetical protein
LIGWCGQLIVSFCSTPAGDGAGLPVWSFIPVRARRAQSGSKRRAAADDRGVTNAGLQRGRRLETQQDAGAALDVRLLRDVPRVGGAWP